MDPYRDGARDGEVIVFREFGCPRIGLEITDLGKVPTVAAPGPSRGLRPYAENMDVDRATFRQLVADGLDQIPEELGRLMDNVAVVVEDWPTPEQLGGRRGTLLGLYEGVALTRRGPLSYGGVAPDKITIFRGPISHLAHDEEELGSLVTSTVIHEVAHHFGISDARLRELGW
jgi:predicted Zn-dependent protease with MMP-like domain